MRPAMGNRLQCKPSGQLHTVKICPGEVLIFATNGSNFVCQHFGKDPYEVGPFC